MLEGLRHRTTALAQRGLAIDALHRKLDIALGRLEGVESLSPSINQLAELGDNLHARARRTEDELRKLEEHFERLRQFLKTYDERFTSFDEGVKSLDELFRERILISEPWLPEEHFAHSEPEYYLAAFL